MLCLFVDYTSAKARLVQYVWNKISCKMQIVDTFFAVFQAGKLSSLAIGTKHFYLKTCVFFSQNANLGVISTDSLFLQPYLCLQVEIILAFSVGNSFCTSSVELPGPKNGLIFFSYLRCVFDVG